MVAQLHLAIVMAIDARLLVLDEPTLGLDPLYRKQFYDTLLADYLDRGRTVLVATHEIEEVQHVLTDVLFIDRGRLLLDASVDDIEARYHEVFVHPDKLAEARALHPIAEREGIGHTVMVFEHVDGQHLAALGAVRTPSIADLFVAVLSRRGAPRT
jgi:ABC-2 type transport system ATP-binding protein